MEKQVEICFAFFGEDQHLIPSDASMPTIGDLALLPQVGDVVFISPRSAWQVLVRDFQQQSPGLLRVQLWLEPKPEMLALRRLPVLRPVPPEEQPSPPAD